MDERRGVRGGPEDVAKTVTGREVQAQVAEPGFRVETLVVVTTLVDSTAYDKESIGDLYRRRWQVELDIRSLKVGLQMDPLRRLTPFMVDKGVWANVLSYNLLRKVAAQAAVLHNYHPRQLSFAATKQAVGGSWHALGVAGPEEELALGRYLLKEVSRQRVGDRPDRCEPRAVKRRPKEQKLLTKPRAEAQAELLRNHPGRGSAGRAPQRC
jgi:hypothetical protein